MNSLKDSNVLAEESITYGGMVLQYRLTDYGSEKPRFRISVKSGSEYAQADVGNDIGLATDCYRAMKEGSVTPCVLEEVAEDFITSRQIFEKSLYK